MRNTLSVYTDEQVTAKLETELNQWSFDDGHLQRTYRTSGWKGSLMVANAVGHLAEVAWHHPDLLVTYSQVTVKVVTHSAGGITAMDFELAKRIEEFVYWQPAGQEGALTGTPQTERHRYIKYGA